MTDQTTETASLLVTFLVTREGEQGHPMDSIVKRVDLADDGTPTTATLERLTKSIAREVVRKAAAAVRGALADAGMLAPLDHGHRHTPDRTCRTCGASQPHSEEQPAPRAWAMPTVPADVKAVRTRHSTLFVRAVADTWEDPVGHWVSERDLIVEFGPLTEVDGRRP